MSPHPALLCPACASGELTLNRMELWACTKCARAVEVQQAVFDLRRQRDPLAPRDLSDTSEERALLTALAALSLGTPWKETLEEYLCELPPAAAEELMQLLREGRGAWAPLLSGNPGTALFLGDARSGTVLALVRMGYAVTSVDTDFERLALGGHRNRALADRKRTRQVRIDAGGLLPFRDGSFDLVVREKPFGVETPAPLPSLEECRRVASSELVATEDNRFGYKESSGQRGDFRVHSPLGFLRSVVEGSDRPTLGAFRRAVAGERAEFADSRAFSLYPHSRDFTHVTALDEPVPRLYMGPKEHKNPLKVLGYRAGLFPHLTPSFAVIARRDGTEASTRRIDRLLSDLAGRLLSPQPEAEFLLATRGNNALVMTALPGGDEEDPTGRWIVRIPLHPAQKERVAEEQAMLARLAREFATVPIPEPLFDGEVDGVFLTCEQRLPGHSAAQFSGEPNVVARLFRDAGEHFAQLVMTPPREVTEEDFGRLVTEKFELVVSHATSASARGSLERMHDLARERLIGLPMPRVLRHCDPRSKHIQIRPDGEVLGYYDWGSAEEEDFPLADLLHLVVHERFHQGLPSAGHAWRLAREGGAGLRPTEREPLDTYCRTLDLEPEVRFVVEEIYPLLVGAMAEKNWDFSRPRWLERSFGL